MSKAKTVYRCTECGAVLVRLRRLDADFHHAMPRDGEAGLFKGGRCLTGGPNPANETLASALRQVKIDKGSAPVRMC